MARRSLRQVARYTVALVGDGHTESIYFTDFRDIERPEGLSIIPELPGRIGSFGGVLQRAVELNENYDRVYALIEMDAILAQNQLSAYRVQKAAAQRAGVIVLENNPCFETWLLLHFRRTGQHFANCNDVVRQLREFIPDYDKNQRFIEAARLYGNYCHLIEDQAIPNAAFLEVGREDQDELYPRAEVYKFFEWYLNRSDK
jgi:hypothetical protein